MLEAHLDVTGEHVSKVERGGKEGLRGGGTGVEGGGSGVLGEVGGGLLTCRPLGPILRGSCGVAS